MASPRLRTALALSVTLAFFLSLPVDSLARDRSRSGGYAPRSSSSGGHVRSFHGSHRSSTKYASCPRDRQGKIKRDPNAVSEFKRTHPKPPGCTDCQVDHNTPLSKGGADHPSNMQWLSKKDQQERTKRELQRD